jgi:hypothetical protein
MPVKLPNPFPYETDRQVAIRDRRLGFVAFAAKLAIFGYVLYTVVFNQLYLTSGKVHGAARMSLKRPSSAYRWQGGLAPYCLGTTAADLNVSGRGAHFWISSTNATYAYAGSNGLGLATPQYPCQFLDALMATPAPPEGAAVFLPTRIISIQERATPAASCATQGHSNCEWSVVNQSTALIADVEMFTLQLSHSVTADGSGLAREGSEMRGGLLGADGSFLDPCAAYADFPAGCPSYIAVGSMGVRDIVSLRTLLRAGGVQTLDQAAGQTPTFAVQTSRYAGVVMVLTLSYTNYYLPGGGVPFGTGSMDASVVEYGLQAQVIPETEFKEEAVFTPGSAFPSPTRTTYNRHGVRIIVVMSGRLGVFSLQSLLINLTVSLGLLSLATVITDFVAFNLCPWRAMYNQYMLRKTVDMSDVLDATDAQTIVDRFRTEDDLIDPVPRVFAELFELKERRQRERARRLDIMQQKADIQRVLGRLQAQLAADRQAGVGSPVVVGVSGGVGSGAAEAGVLPLSDTSRYIETQISLLQRTLAEIDGQLAALEASSARSAGEAVAARPSGSPVDQGTANPILQEVALPVAGPMLRGASEGGGGLAALQGWGVSAASRTAYGLSTGGLSSIEERHGRAHRGSTAGSVPGHGDRLVMDIADLVRPHANGNEARSSLQPRADADTPPPGEGPVSMQLSDLLEAAGGLASGQPHGLPATQEGAESADVVCMALEDLLAPAPVLARGSPAASTAAASPPDVAGALMQPQREPRQSPAPHTTSAAGTRGSISTMSAHPAVSTSGLTLRTSRSPPAGGAGIGRSHQ